MAQWHLAPGSFSWDAAAAALTGGPTPHADGPAPGVGGSAADAGDTGEPAAVPVA
jgi:hypothetical protein